MLSKAADAKKALTDRVRWRADERRWVRTGKLPRCGWMPEQIQASAAAGTRTFTTTHTTYTTSIDDSDRGGRGMSSSLEQRMIQRIQEVFQKRPDAWLVWCDPNGSWLPLLLRVSRNDALNGVRLIQETENTAHEFGSPGKRREVQQLLDAHEHFVLYVKTSKEQLGWLWSQALLAEDIYTESLRSQLLEWGWKPQSILTSDEVVAQLARQHIQDDPSEWSSAKIQLQPQQLLALLAGGTVLAP